MRHLFIITFLLRVLLLSPDNLSAQSNESTEKFTTETFSGLKFRSIGPALMSGRIADIAIHPQNENIWYIAVGSGGIWKTINSGTTWIPVFDNQGAYSIGCVTIDACNPNVIWAGTGENVGGRHVGYGDGVYRSNDGGITWQNMGLQTSEHISKILVHPENSNIIWVAAQGPLWVKGGERGIFKSIDGGKTWKQTLGDDSWTGATDLAIDPRNPDLLYAATWQRQRTAASFMGGGPGSGIYRSTDSGETWEKLTSGLPSGNLGKIGIAVSPQNPDVIYATIELERRSGGVFRSDNRGSSWTKQSDVVAKGTGPHYYQEIYASPHQFDKVYLMDVRLRISEDGGKTFSRMHHRHTHVDNHAIAFRKSDPNYALLGNDGGLYETFDNMENWKHIANLPVTQFYKIAVDDDLPFYNIYGGTQDNNTQAGPSRTDNVHGISNSDWFITLFADGYQPATEPGNPNIVYSQWQQGNLVRYDKATGEIVYIQPQPEANEDSERFNWDAPVLVSPHQPSRLFFASQRVWRSDNRGDSWTAISDDLTRNQERMTMPLMDKTWSWDAQWDFVAMSDYNTITSLSESPLQEGLLYAGTDDGIIQVTEDGGKGWRKIETGNFPGAPDNAFVNDIKADLFDVNTVYVVLDNHKNGDFNPYVFKSNNRGQSWTSITGNLPGRTLTWRIVQDYVKPDLLFLGTEFGIWFTINGGNEWIQLKGGLPAIAFRDLTIQRRENDLVAASFGRGIYILDDFSALREINEQLTEQEAVLFTPRQSWWYFERQRLGSGKKASQGEAWFVADNPPFGTTFTYYLRDNFETKKQIRQKTEVQLTAENKEIPFPGWEALDEEILEEAPKVWVFITDKTGNFICRIEAPSTKGINRVTWDLTIPSSTAIQNSRPNWQPKGPMVAPGTYSAALFKQSEGEFEPLSNPVNFDIVPLREGTLPGSSPEHTVAFWMELQEVQRTASAATVALQNTLEKVDLLRLALANTQTTPADLEKRLFNIKNELLALDLTMNGSKSKNEIGERLSPTVQSRLNFALSGTSRSTYGPTPAHHRSLEIAREQLSGIREQLDKIRLESIPALEKALQDAKSPWIEGQPIPTD